jgi:hypothetical protein
MPVNYDAMGIECHAKGYPFGDARKENQACERCKTLLRISATPWFALIGTI